MSVNPMFVFPDEADNEIGAGLRFGYGFTPRFDMEAKAAFYDGLYFFGGDFEYWLVKNKAWDVSGGAGLEERGAADEARRKRTDEDEPDPRRPG